MVNRTRRSLLKVATLLPLVYAGGSLAASVGVGSRSDFRGLSICTGNHCLAADNVRGYEAAPFPGSYTHMRATGSGSRRTPCTGIKADGGGTAYQRIYITENGTSGTAAPGADGRVPDIDRIMFLWQYLDQLQRAIADGAPVRGYFLWSCWTTLSGAATTPGASASRTWISPHRSAYPGSVCSSTTT